MKNISVGHQKKKITILFQQASFLPLHEYVHLNQRIVHIRQLFEGQEMSLCSVMTLFASFEKVIFSKLKKG